MPSIQISKIQIRRGDETDVSTGVLDPAEMAFALDTGRLFIGPGIGENDAGFPDRGGNPGNNIEVLTESSLETFGRLFDRMNRLSGPTAMAAGSLDRKPFVEGNLEPTTVNSVVQWRTLKVKEILADGSYNEDGVGLNLYLADTDSSAASIKYFVFNAETAIRQGSLDIIDTGDDCQTVDEYSCVETQSPGIYESAEDAYVTGLRFRAIKDGQDRLTIEYQNDTNTTFRIQMQIIVAARRF